LRPDAAATAQRLAETGRRLAAARGRAAAARDGLAVAEAEMEVVLAATGGRCPACGTPVAPASLLVGHRHSGTGDAA
ncbi:DNA repair protein, partial [Methylobacterium sp. IF7SW-B2]|nr:DNA repair protein [Methylobacterium ajmalii]